MLAHGTLLVAPDSNVARITAQWHRVHGGWHDAGDFSIYSASLNTALFWMLEAYEEDYALAPAASHSLDVCARAHRRCSWC